MEYDENGNLVRVNNGCGATTYTWDVRNRLVGIRGFDAQCSPLSASFKYDALGRRIEKTINGKTTKYLYDGLDIIQEIENGAVSVNYIRTLNIDEPLARIKADGTVRYYQQDALGSVIALTDENGVVKTTYSYDPYGNVTISGEPSDNPFQYTGRENDRTGLYYYRARYYSPELQRFISEDPILRPMNSQCSGLSTAPSINWIVPSLIRKPENFNGFIYTRNSPINFRDPSGLIDSQCSKVAIDAFLSCAWKITAGISFGMDLALAACVFTGPEMIGCMTIVLGIAEGPELAGLVACGINAKRAYDNCIKKKNCNAGEGFRSGR